MYVGQNMSLNASEQNVMFAFGTFWIEGISHTLFPRRVIRAAHHKFEVWLRYCLGQTCDITSRLDMAGCLGAVRKAPTWLQAKKAAKWVQVQCRVCVGGRSGLKGPCIVSSRSS